MYIPFEKLSEMARVWVFQANRSFTNEEEQEIETILTNYLNQWASHRSPLVGSFEIKYHRFIIVAAEAEQHICGSSVDGMVRLIQELEQKFQIDLLDKMNVSYKTGEYISYKPLTDFKKMVKERAVSEKTIVFNNLVNTIYEYQNDWEIPLEESWHKRFL